MILGARNAVYILLDSSALNLFNLLNNIKVDTVLIIDISVGIGQRNVLAAELGSLFG